MRAGAVGAVPDDDVRMCRARPVDLDEWAVVNFCPDHRAAHLHRVSDGFAPVDELELPPALIARLERSGHWNAEWHRGWSERQPENWWLDEERA